MAKCHTCGTSFKGDNLKKNEDKAIVKAIKDTFFYADAPHEDVLLRALKSGQSKPVESACGLVTLPGGRRVTLGCIERVLKGGKLWAWQNKGKRKPTTSKS
jgi:hypothetical protein